MCLKTKSNHDSFQKNKTQSSYEFWDTNVSPWLGQTTRCIGSQQKNKKTCRTENFAIQKSSEWKSKKTKKELKYLDQTWELKKANEHKSDSGTNYKM